MDAAHTVMALTVMVDTVHAAAHTVVAAHTVAASERTAVVRASAAGPGMAEPIVAAQCVVEHTAALCAAEQSAAVAASAAEQFAVAADSTAAARCAAAVEEDSTAAAAVAASMAAVAMADTGKLIRSRGPLFFGAGLLLCGGTSAIS
jgi:hypothetical protein